MAMSGGIDSSVASILLLEQGYELVGVTFRTFDSINESCLTREKGCCSVESIMEAKHLAQTLGFEHHILDYRQIFRHTVIHNFVSEYLNGRTPNPCVLCNSHIKWGELLRAADELGCDMIATGHYARIEQSRGHYYLKTAADEKKDQTYFLWMLTEENLRRTFFPLGNLTKQQVRLIAAQHGFTKLSLKKESEEICFIPNNDYRTFIQTESGVELKGEGNYVDATGNILGRHAGYYNYTIGQRKGLGIALGEPRFVSKIDADSNTVTLAAREELNSMSLTANQIRLRDRDWLRTSPELKARIRYRSKAVDAKLELVDNDSFNIQFKEHVWGVTPGQSVVLYKDELVVGGGIIN